MKVTKGLTWPFLLLALAATLVYMAGIASLQYSCYGTGVPGATSGLASAAFGLSDPSSCNHIFRFYWFIFAFVTATLLGLLVTTAIGRQLHFSRGFWVGMLTISTLLMMLASETFLGLTNRIEGSPVGDDWIHRVRTATAGAIMAVAFLIFLMLGVGTDWEHTSSEGHGGVTGRRQEKATSGIPAGATAAPVGPPQNVRVVEQV